MKTKSINSAFTNLNTQAETPAYKRTISCLSPRKETKRTAPKMKQPFQLANFIPFGSIAPWTWRKSIRIIIESDNFSTFCAFVATLSGLFSSCVHKTKIKRLKTCSILKIERLLTTLFCWTNLYFFSNRSCGSSCCLFLRNKLSCSSISDS